jgi:CheY-like chemotaxis protein
MYQATQWCRCQTGARAAIITPLSTETHNEDGRAGVTVLVVDDSTAFRQAAANVVRAAEGFRVVGEAASGEEAIQAAGSLAPDLVLMDVRMPRVDGAAAARSIAAARPSTVIVLLSADSLDEPGEVPPWANVTVLEKRDLRPRTLEALWATLGGSR